MRRSVARGRLRLVVFWASLIVAVLVSPHAAFALATIYFVDSTGDGGLVGPVSLCDDGTGKCTLRAAIQASNANAGEDAIEISIPPSDPNCAGGPCTITLGSALPSISDKVTIAGPGASQATVRAVAGADFRVFTVTAVTVGISGLTISHGVVTSDYGGGIKNAGGGNVSVTNCVLRDNVGFLGGGGISNIGGGTMNVRNTTFVGNRAGGISGVTETVGSGGAILTLGNMYVTNSTLTDNTSNRVGGAIANAGFLDVRNSTISKNATTGSVPTESEGGGIFNNPSVSTFVLSTLIAGNTTIVGGPDVFGSFTSSGFNLIGKSDGGTGLTAPTDQTGTIAAPLDPKLDPAGVRDNGGTTPTVGLSCDSPAIDRGTSGDSATDQRGIGFARSVDDASVPNATNGDGADVGAFELQELCSATPDPFLAYAVKTTKGTPAFGARGPVILGDAFGTAAYTVAKPVTLALPAVVNGAAPDDDDTHLLAYQIKPFKGAVKFAPRVDVHVANPCSNVFVTVKKPVSLLVPTAADLANPVTAPLDADHERDHRLCYQAKVATKRADGTKLPKPPKGTQVDVIDRFQTRRYDVKALTKLCIPTATSGSPVFLKGGTAGTPAPLAPASVRHAEDVLVCYQATPAKRTIPQAGCGAVDPTGKGTPIVPAPAKHASRGGMFVADQLGALRLDTVKEREICVPSVLLP